MYHWNEEKIFFNSDNFFDQMISEINQSKNSVEFETYIFDKDFLGEKISQALQKASQRGVRVKILVDGVGSPFWAENFIERFETAGIKSKIFHPMPFIYLKYSQKPRKISKFILQMVKIVEFLNKRNHRKLCIIDSKIAYVGSMNVSVRHLKSAYGKFAWRDTGIRVVGNQIKELRRTFFFNWKGKTILSKRFWKKRISEKKIKNYLYRFNETRVVRRLYYRELLIRIIQADHKIWITNAYFVPHKSFISALRFAANKGVDIRILVPKYSDVFFLPWVTRAYYYVLLKSKIRIYEYQDSFLHAKSMLIDRYAFLGSSNLNHRSLIHDLELDIVVKEEKNIQLLEKQYLLDLEKSKEVNWVLWRSRSWLERLLSIPFYILRYFL